MRVLVKKFNLKRNGVVYQAGSVVELPDDEARKLIDAAAKEFSCVEAAPKVDAASEKLEADSDGDAPISLGEMTVEELKHFAADNGIDLGKATKKADIISLIEAATDESEGLPDVDAAAMVK